MECWSLLETERCDCTEAGGMTAAWERSVLPSPDCPPSYLPHISRAFVCSHLPLPWQRLPCLPASSACCCGAGGSGRARQGHFLPSLPAPPACLQPAVGQTFLGLLIDIQEWNLSRLRVPRAGRRSDPLLGFFCPYWEDHNSLISQKEHLRPLTPAVGWPGKLHPEVGTPLQPQGTQESGGVGD